MKIEVIGQQGVKYRETIDYAVVMKKTGEFAILDKHIQTIVTLKDEFVKLVQKDIELYLHVQNGALIYKNQVLSIYAINAELARSMDEAKLLVERIRKEASEKQKKQTVDYSKLERDLREQISKSGAGHI